MTEYRIVIYKRQIRRVGEILSVVLYIYIHSGLAMKMDITSLRHKNRTFDLRLGSPLGHRTEYTIDRLTPRANFHKMEITFNH